MAHIEQAEFFESIKSKRPEFFRNTFVLDIGSLDINGNNFSLFDECGYIGLDVAEGTNVDIVCKGHELALPDSSFDVVISSECFEHDMYYTKTIQNMYRMLKHGGLFIFTCATTGRPEHGTSRTTPSDAPLLQNLGDWSDYYMNLTEKHIREVLSIDDCFKEFRFSVNDKTHDLYFYGIKNGDWEKRYNYSASINKKDLHKTFVELSQQFNNLSVIATGQNKEIVDFQEKVLAQNKEIIDLHDKILTQRIEFNDVSKKLNENALFLKDLKDQNREVGDLLSHTEIMLSEVYASKSWRVTKPLRMAADQARKFKRVLAIIAKVARRPILIYKFLALAKKDGVKSALHRTHQFIEHPESMVQNIKLNVDDCVILTTYHCLYVAELIKDNLAKLGKKSEIIFGRPAEGYKKSVHFVICPQMFKSLPELYVSFQMEQSVSSRWFDDAYFTKLEKSFAIFDYSVANIKYLLDNEFYYQKIYFMPLSFRKNACLELSDQYEYDILFYGDVNCERRQNALKTLQKKYQVRIINDLFGAALRDELKKARVVVNVHYYEGALLETTRLYECLSLNKLVVSEKSVDMQNHANLENIVDFVEIGDFEGMLKRVEHWLEDDAALFKKVSENRLALMVQPDWFEFYFMRFLLSVDVIDFEQFYKIAAHNITFTQEIVCLGLIESIDRQADFDKDNHYGIQKFPGLRHRLGWVGCGLSYKFIMKKAKEQELKQITVCEDDVEFLDGWDKRYLTIKEYLKRNPKSWDIFAGLIAVLNPVAHVTNITQLDSEDFIHMDKMVSMVFNVYHADFFETLLSWDESNHDSAVNTIDRFIESTKEVKVVTTTPYLVGHKEDLHSTLWNFQNTQYNVMIEESAEALSLKIEEYQHAKFKF